jgi:hypothetical protein
VGRGAEGGEAEEEVVREGEGEKPTGVGEGVKQKGRVGEGRGKRSWGVSVGEREEVLRGGG